MTRFDGADARADFPYSGPILMTGDDGTAYVAESSGGSSVVTARDVTTWAPRWSVPASNGLPVMATAGGGVVLHERSTGAFNTFDGDGTATSTSSAAVVEPISALIFGEWIGVKNGSDLAAIQAPGVEAAGFAFNANQFSFGEPGGNPQGQNAPRKVPTKGIFVKAHSVAGLPYMHLSVRMVPADQVHWRNHPTLGPYFTNQDSHGNFFATLGAGPVNGTCSGTLQSDVNRVTDVEKEHWRIELAKYETARENEFIQRLFELDSNYPDDLSYECFPDAGSQEFNSNSYAVGLLNAAGLPLPAWIAQHPRRFDGWTKPVPPSKFAPRSP